MTNKRIRYTGIPAYLKLEEAAYVFSISQNTVRKIAVEAGALRKLNKNVVINYELMRAYVETFEAFE